MFQQIVAAVFHALSFAVAMGWQILWALILGFILSGVVQAVVTKGEMSRLLPDDSPRTILFASALGAASSSCSYAAVALARSIFKKGGNLNAAMAFQFASTNLVLELGIILAVLIGWQFTLAEFVGGPIMIVLLVLMLRLVMSRERVAEAARRAGENRQGRMEGHAAMDMLVSGQGSVLARALSPKGLTAISHFFVMDWVSVWSDIVLGLLISGALAAWVPDIFWKAFFLVNHPLGAKLAGPFIRTAGRSRVLRMFGRQRADGSCIMEWRDQLRRGGRISFCRSDPDRQFSTSTGNITAGALRSF